MKINSTICSMTRKNYDNSFIIEFDDGSRLVITTTDPRYASIETFYNEIKNVSPLDRPHAIDLGLVKVPDFNLSADSEADL